MSEFGRTPRINQYYGRDHWSKAWSVAPGRCRPPARGRRRRDQRRRHRGRPTARSNGQDLFHTYLRAVGIDPVVDEFAVNGRDFQIADPASYAIEDLLA